MRIPILPFVMTIIVCIIVDLYVYKISKKRCQSKIPSKLHLWSAIGLYTLLIVGVFMPMRTGESDVLILKMWLFFAYFTTLAPKAIFILFDLVSYIPTLFNHDRWSIFSVFGGLMAFLSFCTMWWGALVNRFDVSVKPIDITITNLPDMFEDYRIVQISDLHLGSYTDSDYILQLVNYINELKPDLIVFTGDIVNRKTDELYPFADALSQLKAGDGVLSILGNHDYGDYYDWCSDSAKSKSVSDLVVTQREMGWNLLLNNHTILRHGSDSIAVIGVENIGDPPFKVYGKLKASYPDLSDNVVKILLSHNPIHWINEIENNENVNIALTLAGHTHAMQIELFGFSPAEFRYDYWGGLYADDSKKHQLYVNIGIGTVGLPMRLGATPEVTILTLKRA